MIIDVIIYGLENGAKMSPEACKFVGRGSISWRKYYRGLDCDEEDDIMLLKGVEDLLPPNRGWRVGPFIRRYIQIDGMPKTTTELDELAKSLRRAGAPRCSKYSTTQSLLDWIWHGYVPIRARTSQG